MPDAWLSAYVRGEELTALLRGGIRPFVEEARAAALCDRFFFIRYWEGGPHVRLRMRPARGVDLDVLRGRVDGTFASVEHALYEPELERYGGAERMEIAERQFEASSRAVLSVLDDDWPYDKALGTAVTMHAAFAAAAGWSRAEGAAFFRRAIAGLAHWLVGPRPSAEAVRELLDAFAVRFAPQRDALCGHVDAVWQAALEDGCADVPWLAAWTDDMRALLAELRGTFNGSLDPAFAILVSYVHMTNNRLGVANRDEAWLAYLLAGSLGDAP
jgi:thiopeptide-type bacteriocin biosynthesis protein